MAARRHATTVGAGPRARPSSLNDEVEVSVPKGVMTYKITKIS
jgi:hypothetical protein